MAMKKIANGHLNLGLSGMGHPSRKERVGSTSDTRYHVHHMRVPNRKSEELHRAGRQTDDYLTRERLESLRRTLADLQGRQRPQAVEDLARAREMGDLSENAAYSEAKGRLARIDGRIFGLKERIKNAVLIEDGAGADGVVRIGATVTLESGGRRRTYRIVGSQETDPSKGRISHASPLGAALVGKKAGQTVVLSAATPSVEYRIISVE
jgi:transcription elongation factor GreA